MSHMGGMGQTSWGMMRSMRRKDELYRWVVGNVQEGEEDDGRRAVVGKNGNLWRAYITLCRALDIPVDYAAAQNRSARKAPGSRSALNTRRSVTCRPKRAGCRHTS